MSITKHIGAILTWTLICSATFADELSTAPRQIAKEPTYQTKSPRYGLLVFGPEAKTRIWCVTDGDTLYVDRNGNGDLTDDGEKVTKKNKDGEYRQFEIGDVRDGKLLHKGLVVTQTITKEEWIDNAEEFARIKGKDTTAWIWNVRVAAERPKSDKRDLPAHIQYLVNGDRLGWLVFARQAKDAPIIHFNGPWTLELQDNQQRFTAGHKSMIQIGVGTRGVGAGTFTWMLYPDTIPNDVYPKAEITFPSQTLGGKPIQLTCTLKERC